MAKKKKKFDPLSHMKEATALSVASSVGVNVMGSVPVNTPALGNAVPVVGGMFGTLQVVHSAKGVLKMTEDLGKVGKKRNR